MIKRIASAAIFVGFMLCIPHTGETQTAWNKIVAEAKKEGSVVVNGPSIRELSQGLTDGFKKAYGINVEYLGLGFEVITRMEREALAGKPSIDMYMGGTRTDLILMDKNLVETIDDKLLLPEVKEPNNWRGGKLKWSIPESLRPTDHRMGDDRLVRQSGYSQAGANHFVEGSPQAGMER